MNKIHVKIKNIHGLKVLFISGLPVESIAITAYIAAGLRDDPQGKEGLAHFCEHMLFSGTKKYPSHRLEAEALEKYGGWHIAFTWVDEQYHSIKIPKQNVEVGLSLMLDSLFFPLLKSEDLLREKNVVLEEINNTLSNSNYALWDEVWMPLFFQNTPLEQSYIGNERSINSFNLKDVKGFLQKYFTKERIILSIAGNNLTPVEKILANELSKDTTYRKGQMQARKIKLSQINRFKQVKQHSNNHSSEIGVGVSTVPFKHTRERISIDIIKDMIGGYFGTNLITTLKDKGGLIYTWRMIQDNFIDCGYAMFQTSCNNKNTKKVIMLILKEFERISTGDFSLEEVNIAKGHLKGSLMLNTEKPEDYNSWYGSQLIKGEKRMLSINEYSEIVDKISLDELKGISRKIFNKELVLVGVLGNADLKQIQDLLS